MVEEDLSRGGVLLYYKFLDLGSRREEIQSWFTAACEGENFVGRVRVAKDGINATLGGSMGALRRHILALIAHPILQGADIDFKLSESMGPRNEACKLESHFHCLRVALCDEVVTLGKGVPLTLGAPHITAQEFHGELQSSNEALVLIDCRNEYESRIGYFQAPAGSELLRPPIRKFSLLPEWLDANLDRLRSKRILMYCTGGVRCERASALIRSFGAEYSNVAQLHGGVDRYFQAFPDGGFYRGKLLVFDERCAVSPPEVAEVKVVGQCAICEAAWDDYGSRSRCAGCRVLMLACEGCRRQGTSLPNLLCDDCRIKDASTPKGVIACG
jgi:predicted sulfurtransferase